MADRLSPGWRPDISTEPRLAKSATIAMGTELPTLLQSAASQGVAGDALRKEFRRASSMKAHEYYEPGNSYIITTAAILSKGAELDSDDLMWLKEGASVHILEVVNDDKGRRVRGRVETPAGWVSLFDMDKQQRWAVRQESPSPSMEKALPE